LFDDPAERHDTIPPMRHFSRLLLSLCAISAAFAAKTLDIYFIDVEGGQATLIVTPNKQSMLVDAGWPGFNKRDSQRIAKVAKNAGAKEIDYLVTTHFHTDHVGGVPQLVEALPVKTFVDHGANVEKGKSADELSANYAKAIATGKHLVVKAGDKLPVKGVDVTIVQANGDPIASPLAGAGAPNQFCASAPKFAADPSENARSVGLVLQYGKFKFVDLGDLTAAKEVELVCPNNRIGTVDLYLTTHHGLDQSNAQPIVHALHPRIAVMNNGAKKGGSPTAWQTIKDSPGLEDMWQVHYSFAGGKEHNVAESMIANLEEHCEGNYIRVSANPDGSMTLFNSRNKFEKTYPAR
jgi:beta-lactamase superfamily II metal-dependent hydrolase